MTSKTRSNETSALMTMFDPDVGRDGDRAVNLVRSSARDNNRAGVDRALHGEPAANAVGGRPRRGSHQHHRDEERGAVHRLLDTDIADRRRAGEEPFGLNLGPANSVDQKRTGHTETLRHRRVHGGIELVGLT